MDMMLLIAGEVAVTQRDALGHRQPVVTHAPGAFIGELAQLDGRPALVDAHAVGDVEVVAIPPERLRALLIAEAELGEMIMRALILRRVSLLEMTGTGPIIIGRPGQRDVLRLESFLDRNGYPNQTLDPETDGEARALVERFHIDPLALPIVLCPSGAAAAQSERERAGPLPGHGAGDRYLEALRPGHRRRRPLGAGRGGLCRVGGAVGADSLLDCRAFGGQAGASSRIPKTISGFPTGITGMALMSHRAYNQAVKFGVEMAIPDQATGLDPRMPIEGYQIDPDQPRGGAGARGGGGVGQRGIGGCRWRTLTPTRVRPCTTGPRRLEGRLCSGQDAALVGGGNSAGQAVVFLAGQARKVWMLVRGPSLEATMSRYLIDRIESLPNVEVLTQTEVTELEGDGGALENVVWRHRTSGEITRKPLQHLFLFIGADPNTDWLKGSGAKTDAKGFLCTGEDAGGDAESLETSLPGVFAIGDVRAGSTKRVAAGVGEGAQVVAALHAYLGEAHPADAAPTMETRSA